MVNTTVDQAARAKARERRVAMEQDRATRDARIEDAAVAIFTALAARVRPEEETGRAPHDTDGISRCLPSPAPFVWSLPSHAAPRGLSNIRSSLT